MIRRAPLPALLFPRSGMAILCALALAAAACSTADQEVIGADTAETDGGVDTQIDVDAGDQPIAAIEANFVVEGAEGTLLGLTADFAKALPKDDKYPAKAGIQVDVVVTTTAADGAQVALRLDNVPVGSTQTAKGGKATFSEVDIGCSTAGTTLEATVTPAQGNPAVKYKKLQLDCSDACLVQLDAPTTACITEDIDPATLGIQHNIQVASLTAGCTSLTLSGVDAKGNSISQTKLLEPGLTKTTFLVTLSPDELVPYGSKAKLQAVAKDPSLTARPSVASPELTLQVTNERPVVTVDEPISKGVLNLLADADPTIPGIQTLLKGTATTVSPSDAGASVTVFIGADATATALPGPGQFQAPISFPATNAYTVTVKATNGCGLSNEPPTKITYQVNTDVASLKLVSPAAGSTLLAKDDLVPASTLSYQTKVQVAVTGGTPGSQVSLFCRKAGLGNPFSSTPTAVALLEADAATLSFDVTLSVEELGNQVTCELRDDAPNPATAASFDWTVGLPPPQLIVTDPPTDNVLTNKAAIDLVLFASHLDGRPVTVVVKAADGAVIDSSPFGTVKGTAAEGKVTLPGDGTYTIAFESTDVYGNLASLSLGSDPTVTVTLDSLAPTVQFVAPTKLDLSTVDDPDANPAMKGYQIAAAVSFSDAVLVCLSTSGGEKTCVVPLPGDQTAVFANVSLQAGTNTLTATATDAAGNTSGPVPLLVTLVSDAPAVAYLSPVGDLTTTQDSLLFKVAVNKGGAGGPPIAGAVTTVEIDGVVSPGVVVTEASPGIYQFTVSGLSAKPITKVRFSAAVVGAEDKIGYTPDLSVTFKSGQPAISIASPTNGAVLNIASSLCIAGPADCQAQIKLKTTNVEDGSTAQVTVTCGTNLPVTATVTVVGDSATLSGAVLGDQSVCSLSAQVTDAAGSVALAEPVTVSVDRKAPFFGNITSPIDKQGSQLVFVAKEDVDGDPTNGLQVTLKIALFGVTSTAKVGLTVTDDLGSSTKFNSLEVIPGQPGQPATVNFGLLSLPDGEKVKLVFATADEAGNPATTTISAQITAAKPDIKIGNPLNNAEGTSCTNKGQCGGSLCYQGKCVASWNKNQARVITFTVQGIPAGGLAALCSNAAGLTGPACATAGFKQVATQQLTGPSGAIAVPANVADGLYNFIVEASLLPTVPWSSSLLSSVPYTKQRTVLIDTVAPEIVSLTPPAATGALAACLNEGSQSAADSGQAGGQFSFQVKTSEEASVAVTANGGQVGSAATAGNSATVAVTLAQDGTTVFAATAFDLVGNPATAKTLSAILVDTQKPTGAFSNPSGKFVLAGSSLDVVVSSQSADTAGQQTVVRDGATSKGSAVMTNGQAVFPHATFAILTQGVHTLQADLRDVCGNNATIGTSPAQVTVDTEPPTLVFVSPAQGASFNDSADADPAKGGYQVSTTFGTTGATGWSLELAQGCDGSFANCTGAFAKVAQGSATAPGGNEPAVVLTVPFGAATPNYSLRLTATDANGNTAVATRGFKVQLSGCLVSLQGLTNGGVYNTSSCASPGKNCAAILVQVSGQHVGPCGTVAHLQFKKGGIEVAKKVPADQAASQDIDMKDGDNTTIEVLALDGAGKVIASSGAQTAKADLTLPKVAFVAGSVLTVPTPASNGVTVVGAAKDLNGQAGHQIHLLVQATDSGLAGGKLTKLERTVGLAAQALQVSQPASLPVAYASADVLTELQYAVLAEDATNTVTATVADAAGNIGTGQIAILVDWTAPAKITLNDFAGTDLNARRPSARLSFTAVGDNGSSGAASSYEVRYSAMPINTAQDFDAACDAKTLPSSSIQAPLASGSADQVFVEGPDPRPLGDPCKFAPLTDSGASAWYFAVAAVDKAGNRGAPSNTLSTIELRMRYANITLAAGAPADLRSRIGRIGDINGDGLGEFTLGGGVSAPLCIIYGRNSATVSTIDLTNPVGDAYPNYTCLANPGGLGAQVAGGDVNGDGIGDLVAGLDGSSVGNFRRIRVYLGKANGAIATSHAVEISNVYNSQGNGVFKLAVIGNFNGDLNNGKPVGDIALTSRNGILAYDRVMVIPGNVAWSAAAPTAIDVDNVTHRISNNVANIRLVDSSASPAFGLQLRGVGNLLADSGNQQYDDLCIAQMAAPQGLYVLKGRALASKGGTKEIEILLSTTATNPAAVNDVEAAHVLGSGTVGLNSFGMHLDTINVDGDALPDLVVQHSSAASAGGGLYWLQGSWIASLLGKVGSVSPEAAVAGTDNLFKFTGGYRLRDYHFAPANLGNFADRQGSGGPFTDVVHGRTPSATDGANNRVIIRLAMTRPKSAIPNQNSLEYADIAIYEPSAAKANFGITTTSVLGPVSLAPLGDFNGDGLPDLVIGSLDSSLIVAY